MSPPTRSRSALINRQTFMTDPGVPGLISIVIPCYNRAHIVRERIDSVLAQTYRNFEVILIDDGSTDNTREAVSTYEDRRIRYFYKANGGLSAARNSGLDSARGEFVAFLDSDDVWQPWKLSAQVEIFRRHPDVGLIWSDMSTFETLGEILAERHIRAYYSAYGVADFDHTQTAGVVGDLLPVGGAPAAFADCRYYVADVFNHMFSGNLVHPSTAIVRRERLRQSGPFEPEVTGHGAEDYHFYFRICSHGPVGFLDAPTTLYRVHSAQLSTCNRLHEARGNLNVMNHWMKRLPPTIPPVVLRRSLASSHAWLGLEELNAGNARVATHHLWQSLRLHRRQPSTMRLFVVSLIPRRVASVMRTVKGGLHTVLARALPGLALLLLDDQSILFQLVGLLQPEMASGM